MPVYDYTCLECHQRFDIFLTYAEYGTRPVTCPTCGSPRTRRRLPRVRTQVSDSRRMGSLPGDLSDPSALARLEDDPRAMGRMMRQMGREMGETMPPELNEVVDRLEKGQSPEQIEQDLPDLGAGADDDL
jgi:putative FmdB family regulatory protein